MFGKEDDTMRGIQEPVGVVFRAVCVACCVCVYVEVTCTGCDFLISESLMLE